MNDDPDSMDRFEAEVAKTKPRKDVPVPVARRAARALVMKERGQKGGLAAQERKRRDALWAQFTPVNAVDLFSKFAGPELEILKALTEGHSYISASAGILQATVGGLRAYRKAHPEFDEACTACREIGKQTRIKSLVTVLYKSAEQAAINPRYLPALFFALTNIDSDHWRNRQDVQYASESETKISVEMLMQLTTQANMIEGEVVAPKVLEATPQ